jgi:hypothetical protein
VRPRGRALFVRTLGCVRVDVSVLPPGNFITDATMRLSHGRPSVHRLIVRACVRLVRVTTLVNSSRPSQSATRQLANTYNWTPSGGTRWDPRPGLS